MKKMLKSALEKLGLDWLPELFGRRAFKVTRPSFEVSDGDRDLAIDSLDTDDSILLAVTEAAEAYSYQENRIQSIEDKARWLYSASSLPSAVALAGIGYFASLVGSPSPITVWSAIGLLVLSLVALLFTALLSWKTLHVHDYTFQAPTPNFALSVAERGVRDSSKDKTKALYSAMCHNAIVGNIKATYLGGAQLWFRNSVALILLVLTAVPLTLALQSKANGVAPQPEVVFGYPGISSPFDQDPEQKIVDILSTVGEGSNIGLALHYFSDETLRESVRAALERGAAIRLMIESDNVRVIQATAVDYEALEEAGDFTFRVDSPPSYRMHHKYMVVQDQIAVTGSYNWSDAADIKAWEDIIILTDETTVSLFWDDFERLWNEFSELPIQSPSELLP